MIRDGRRHEKAGELEPAVAVRRAHHGNLDALIAQSSDTPSPFSFDRGPPFELEAELAKEINRRCKVIDDDSYVVHPCERHVSNLQSVVHSDNGPRPDCREAGDLRQRAKRVVRSSERPRPHGRSSDYVPRAERRSPSSRSREQPGIAGSIESASRYGSDLRKGGRQGALGLPLHAARPCVILNRVVQYSKARLDASFAALSDATRRGVLEQLGRSDASITDLAEKFHMTLTGMKKHVGVLEQAGLVTTEKGGRVRACKIGPRPMEEETAWIERDRHLWDGRLGELDKVVEELKRKEKVDGRKKRE